LTKAVIAGQAMHTFDYHVNGGRCSPDGKHLISTENGFSGANVENEMRTRSYGVHKLTNGKNTFNQFQPWDDFLLNKIKELSNPKKKEADSEEPKPTLVAHYLN
jgi:hypothetical protein